MNSVCNNNPSEANITDELWELKLPYDDIYITKRIPGTLAEFYV